MPPAIHEEARAAGRSVHEHLTELAWAEPVGAHGLIALDWHNGNRSVLVDASLSGLLVGTTIATRPEEVYRALVEATAFGTRVIVETFRDAGVTGGFHDGAASVLRVLAETPFADETRETLDRSRGLDDAVTEYVKHLAAGKPAD